MRPWLAWRWHLADPHAVASGHRCIRRSSQNVYTNTRNYLWCAAHHPLRSQGRGLCPTPRCTTMAGGACRAVTACPGAAACSPATSRDRFVAAPVFRAVPRAQRRRRSTSKAFICRADTASKGGGLAQLLHSAQTAPDDVTWSCATGRGCAAGPVCLGPGDRRQAAGPPARAPASPISPAPRCRPPAPPAVVENREASVDGSVRTLLLSVEDRVNFLEGRKVRHVQENRRWIDDYRWGWGTRHVCSAHARSAAGSAGGVARAWRLGGWLGCRLACRCTASCFVDACCHSPRWARPPPPHLPRRVPGQFVAVRYCGQGSSSTDTDECSQLVVARRLLSLASSPYEARRDSALLDASLVELLVSRTGGWVGRPASRQAGLRGGDGAGRVGRKEAAAKEGRGWHQRHCRS